MYPGQVPLETDLLNTNRNIMLALGGLIGDIFGTGNTYSGLSCVPTIPATLNVTVNPGGVYSQQNIDNTAYSSLPLNTAQQTMKQGILATAVNLATPAPATNGFSVNYLISAAFLEADINAVVLPYYNASNPQQAWSGPGGLGAPNTTTRQNTVSLTLTAGIAATTGTQTTPATPAGQTALYVVTVAYGQTTVTAGNITKVSSAPTLPSSLLAAIQTATTSTASDTGTANAYALTFSPPLGAPVAGAPFWMKVKTTNTGASTLNATGTAYPLVGGAHSPLQGNELVANGWALIDWNATLNSYVVLECTGASVQVGAAVSSGQAVQFGQVSGVVGQVRNLAMNVSAASASATATADEIIVESALGGLRYCIPNFNKTINLATTGAGGMDTGTPPASGFVALYAIYSPATGASALLATNATSAVQPEVYGGANMPAGYAASALVSVVPTNASGQFVILNQQDRTVSMLGVAMFSTSTTAGTPTIVNNLAVPLNARFCSGFMQPGASAAGNIALSLYATSAGGGAKILAQTISGSGSIAVPFERLRIVTAQRAYYTGSGSGTVTLGATVNQYEF